MNGTPQLNPVRYGLQGLRHYWRVNLAVMLGVIAGTAVLSGAMIVGDSVRFSLRKLTLERLGLIDQILLSNHFFSPELAARLDLTRRPLSGFSQAVPVILISPSTVETSRTAQRQRRGQVTLIGCSPEFWQLDDKGPRPQSVLQPRQIILNQPLADDLQVHVGDRVVVRLPKTTRVAADSPLGEKTDRVQSLVDLEIIEILPADGLGRFSLRANQALPRTAYVSSATLQDALDQPDKVNAILLADADAESAPTTEQTAALRQRIRPTLDDANLRLKTVTLDYWPSETEQPRHDFQYLNLSTDTMLFAPAAEQAIAKALDGLSYQAVLTYLANSISKSEEGESEQTAAIPYSTVSALDDNRQLTPLVAADGTPIEALGEEDIVLNRWAADDLGAKPGDLIRLSYFAPETTHGVAHELSHVFRLKAIVPLREPATPFRRQTPARYLEAPFRANDPDLTPEVPGITDQDSIDAWDPPFPFDYRRIRKPKDDDYWERYRTTPKAFVSKTAGDSLWGSRFGQTTSFRIAGGDAASRADVTERITAAMNSEPTAFGWTLLEVKRDGLQAAQGTTPFNALFLGFSFFIMAAALLLVCLLFRLSLEQRAGEAGLLLSVGLSARQVSRLFLGEGLVIAACGAVIGTLLGVGYAALMIAGLRTWWLDAVVTPFLELHIGRYTLPFGAVMGCLAALLAIFWTVRSLRKLSLRDLLARNICPLNSSPGAGRRLPLWIAAALWVIALVSAMSAVFLRGEAQAGAFFAAGACVLIAILLQVAWWLRRPLAVRNLRRHGFSLAQLVVRNIGRNSGRSTLTLALMAAACFLIIAISAFRLSPTTEGTGSFQLLAESDVPLFDDLDDAQVRADLLGSQADRLRETRVFSFRLQDGDDASCRNLYQVQRPRVLGVPAKFINRFDDDQVPGFGWAASAATSIQERRNPWQLLDGAPTPAIPVVLDKNTAMYSLHLMGGVGEEFDIDFGANGKRRFRVVGLLANSVLQGSLLISEANLLQHFPDVSGYRYFLIQAPETQVADVRQLLAETFRDQGLQINDTRSLLTDLLAVQNTYLSTFQSLGGLGLLLGTFGLVSVQLRSVFERRAELALLRATGFSQQRIGWLITLEHLALLLGGLGIGIIAALVVVLPHAWTTAVHPPWMTLSRLLLVILAVGMASGYLALRPVVRAPIMGALRGE